MIYYATRGEIRGPCGHRHKSVRTAFDCLQRDAAGCHMQGGYSDRRIVGVEDGEEFAPVPYDSLGKPMSVREKRLCCEINYFERRGI